ncbi:MAG: NADH-quinone oxidoreductase subunit L [Planctomycetota bacterium]|nr:NADH-quinone oxidoreductase subunit L [Planctomycetota bacterium]
MPFVYVLIPLLPLLACILIALLGARLGEKCAQIGVVAVGISCALAIAAFAQVVVYKPDPQIFLYTMLHAGDLQIDIALHLDQLSVLVLLLVTGVGFVVHVYSARYMTGDARFTRFFAVMALFTFGMITLVMSRNLLMLFMSWEVMGICSYLLISHQSDRRAACHAATKAFLVNAIADVGLLFGIVLTYTTFGTLDIPEILQAAESSSGQTINLLSWIGLTWQVQTVTLITLLFFMGCLGKSAQIPLHVWLPNAMEAPTPVSALIHAATMVNAGPYLLVRFSALVMLSPVAMAVIAIVGGSTALFAGLVSLTQSDIKKMLAYSTISQIGFMIMSCGLGAFVAAIFHMLAHGFLKGFLFLSTGNQLDEVGSHDHHATTAPQRPPAVLCLGALLLAFIPSLFFFWGQPESLWATHTLQAHIAFWVIGLLTIFFTAMYLFRGIATLFQPSDDLQPQLFSARQVTGIIAGAVVLSLVLLAVWNEFVPFLVEVVKQPYGSATDSTLEIPRIWAIALPLLAAAAGWALAFARHRPSHSHTTARSPWSQTLYLLFLNKFYFDEFYTACIVLPMMRFTRSLWRRVDSQGIDRLVMSIGNGCVALAHTLWQLFDVQLVQRLSDPSASSGLRSSSVSVETAHQTKQTGSTGVHPPESPEVEPRTLQHHLSLLMVWLAAAFVCFYWLVS